MSLLRILVTQILFFSLIQPVSAATWSSHDLIAEGDRAMESGQVGEATLAWHRARLLDPRSPEVAERLPDEAVPWISSRNWSALLISGLSTTAIGLGLVVVAPRRRGGLLVGVAGACAVTAAVPNLVKVAELRDVVVVQAPTSLQISPAGAATSVQELDEGDLLRVEGQTYGGFERASGAAARGWVSADDVVRMVPNHD